MDNALRRKLEDIHERGLLDMSDEDLEEGISFVYRRRSDSDLVRHTEPLCVEEEEEQVNVHEKRKAFLRMKSVSFDEEQLAQMLRDNLRDNLETCASTEKCRTACVRAPVIVTTNTSQEDPDEPIVPKQADGLLQVSLKFV